MQTDLQDGRVAGTLLVVSAVVTTVALTHHPVLGGHRHGDAAAALAAAAPISGPFHAFMIVMLVVLYLGLTGLCLRRGLRSALVLAGLVATSLGCAAEIGAALIDGFFGPAFGAHLAANGPVSSGDGMPVLAAAAIGLQILAKFGVLALVAAIALWSIELFDRDRAHVVLAIAGCLGSALLVVLLATATTTMTAHNVALIFLIPAAWYAAAGVLMIQNRL